jgi:1-acyl-sn-glycerol-3-phosphate acyltransferase
MHPSGHKPAPPPPPDQATIAGEHLLSVIQAVLSESRQRRDGAPARISLDMDFDRDLGMDSLARVELLSRIEKRFGVVLDDRVFTEARTPRALLQALSRAGEFAPAALTAPVGAPAAVEASVAPDTLKTLTEVLEWHAEHHPERVHIRLYDDHSDGKTISYHGLLSGARRIASGLQSLGLQRGEPVVLMLQTEPDYFFSFFGVLLAGGVPVPIYPPARADQIEDHVLRQIGILDNCAAPIMITLPEGRTIARLLKSRVDSLKQVVTAAELVAAATVPLARPELDPDDIAFLQYTSGSTGAPKGVMLTHANLLANIRAMATHVDAGPQDVFVSWLPLYHDLGLIGAWLGSLYCATQLVVMSPIAFITRPLRWLQALHRFQATISAAPNFGFELCLQRISDEELAGIDLSRWRIACNGAEPVNPETLERFHDRFSRHGLHRETLMPVYGLAECSVGLTFTPLGRGPLIDRIRRDPFQQDGIAVPAAPDESAVLRFVSCGMPLAGHEVRVVDATGRELPDRQTGRLEFRGPSSTQGYYRNPEATRSLFDGDWLDSGDLAYVAGGEVYLTGRVRDIIIHAGRNLYPHEIEDAIGQIDGIRAGRVAAFGATDPALGTERLVIVAETRARDPDTQTQLRGRINQTVVELCGVPPDDLVIATPGTILKTPSGKVRRAACRERYEHGEIALPQPPAWRQLMRIGLGAIPQQLRRLRRLLLPALVSVWAHLMFWPTALLTWFLVVCVMPTRSLRWKTIRLSARWLLPVTGIRVRVEGREHLPGRDQACLCIANHASYLDALLLIRVLPDPVCFVAKAELRARLIARLFLQRIGAVYVERFDAQQGTSDVQELVSLARAGTRLMFFPEGTFTRSPGLRPFRMGAFITAVAAGTPLFPIALRGSRSLLRDGSWWPNRGEVIVTFLPLIAPKAGEAGADDWSRARELRARAYAALLAHCGEPELLEGRPSRRQD